MEVPNYWIDKKLKRREHYWLWLGNLIELFRYYSSSDCSNNPLNLPLTRDPIANPVPFKIVPLPVDEGREEKTPRTGHSSQLKQEIRLIEDTFKSFFLDKSLNGSSRIRSVNRVNRKIKAMVPQLDYVTWGGIKSGYSLTHSVPLRVRKKADPLNVSDFWMWLAVVMTNLDPKLVNQCPYCKKIFFSRQRKRYHSECQSKYFSEKYKKEGLEKKWSKDYREREKRKAIAL